jgi:hypothetical protein
MKEKVYCKDCKFLTNHNYDGMQGECSFEENVIIQHSWYKQIFVYRDNPSNLNKNNDCSWFEKGNWIISAPPKKP